MRALGVETDKDLVETMGQSRTREHEGSRQFWYRGEWMTTRELYEHPDRKVDMTLRQFHGRMNRVRLGFMSVEWALEARRGTSRGTAQRMISLFYAGSELDAGDARDIGEFVLRFEHGESPEEMAQAAVDIGSHGGAVEGVYLVRVSDHGHTAFWVVGVWDGKIHAPRPWND